MPGRPASPMASLSPPLHDPVMALDQTDASVALSPRSGPIACEPRAPRASPRIPSRGRTKTSRATFVPARHRTPSTLPHCILAEADQSDGSELDQPHSRSENDLPLPAPFHPRPNRPHPCTQLSTPSRTRDTTAQSMTADTTPCPPSRYKALWTDHISPLVAILLPAPLLSTQNTPLTSPVHSQGS
jgi:hypothetical protein